MNRSEVYEASRRFSLSCKAIEQYFARNNKHLEYFLGADIDKFKYVMLTSKGLICGYKSKGKVFECLIEWEDFITYTHKDIMN